MKSFKCVGDAAEFMLVLATYFPEGCTKKGLHGMITYRTEGGGVVHFWPTVRRIHCQGPRDIAVRLDRLLRCYMGVVEE